MWYVIYGQYLVAKYDNKQSAIDCRDEDSRHCEVFDEGEALRLEENIGSLIDDSSLSTIDSLKELKCTPDPYQYKRKIAMM